MLRGERPLGMETPWPLSSCRMSSKIKKRALLTLGHGLNGKMHPKKANLQQIDSLPKMGWWWSGCTDGQQALCLAVHACKHTPTHPLTELLEASRHQGAAQHTLRSQRDLPNGSTRC